MYAEQYIDRRRFTMTRTLVAGCFMALSCVAASAAPPACRLTLEGIAGESAGCAGVTICADGPADRCTFRGPVVVKLSKGKPMRLRPAQDVRCVTAMRPDDGDEMAVKVSARVRGKRLRARAAVSCQASPPPPDDGQCSGLTLPVPIVGRRAHFPPSSPTEGTCADSEGASNYTNPSYLIPAAQASELHVIGVYEPDCSRSSSEWPFECLVEHEPITVVVEPRPKPVVLALTAYEPVAWRIEVRSGAVVERVLTSGYEAQAVEGVPAAIVQNLPVETYAYGWEVSRNSGGGGYWEMMSGIRDATGLVETSFQGCYTGARFAIPYADHPPTTCEPSLVTGDESVAQAAVTFPGCTAVAAESAACISIVDGGLALLGADSGTICPFGENEAGTFPDPSGASVGWLGEVLYQCTYDEGLVRIDLRSGARERLEMPCEAVTDHDGTLLVAPGYQGRIDDLGSVYQVNGYRGLLSAGGTRLELSTSNSRFTAHAGQLYSAWHATDTIDVQDLDTGASVRQVPLEGYDGWIFGLDVTDDGRLFVAGMDDDGTLLMIFDAESGVRLGEHRLGGHWRAAGLACRAAGSRRSRGNPPRRRPARSPAPPDAFDPVAAVRSAPITTS
jgi:hypothetical protein